MKQFISFFLIFTFTIMTTFSQSYRKTWRSEVEKAYQQSSQSKILTMSDIEHLPVPVQKYLIYTKSVGMPVINNIHIRFTGWFKMAPDKPYARFNSEQYNFYPNPSRFYYMTMRVKGIGAKGLHVYKNENATMKIKIAGLFTVADASGAKMNQGETVTVFNDMCLMAPSALAFANVEWETVDSLTVKAIYTNGENRISATLYFNEEGQLINFISNDRFQSADGKEYQSYSWSTPVGSYIEVEGRMIPSYGEAIWDMPEGQYCYGKFELKEADFNCTELKK